VDDCGSTSPRRYGRVPSLIAGLALELAPIRVNLIAAGFADSLCMRLTPEKKSKS